MTLLRLKLFILSSSYAYRFTRSHLDDQREKFQTQVDQNALAGIHVLVDAIKFPRLHVAHQADIFHHLDVQPG